LKDWCDAYHGTNWEAGIKILSEGLRNPGSDGVRVRHGQAGGSGRSIYMSPAVGYAAFPVYAPFQSVGTDHWVQVVVQIRVNPAAINIQPGTLRNKYWPNDIRFDPNFDNVAGIEWTIENPEDHEVVALLMREFGPGVDTSIYGPIAAEVTNGDTPYGSGPQFVWTDRLLKSYREQGFMVTGGR